MQTWNLVAHTETTVRIYSKFQINLSQDKSAKLNPLLTYLNETFPQIGK